VSASHGKNRKVQRHEVSYEWVEVYHTPSHRDTKRRGALAHGRGVDVCVCVCVVLCSGVGVNPKGGQQGSKKKKKQEGGGGALK
jgi:hypothetical protein